jgi:hypothetical protein
MTARLLLLAPLLLLIACSKNAGNPAPPRVDTPLPVPALASTLEVPVTVNLDQLERRIDTALPQQLLTIDKVEQACVPAQKVALCLKRNSDGKCKIGFDKTKITPDIACHIKGAVTRGPLRLSGSGDTLLLAMPIAARVSARDARDRLKGETATAKAEVRARIHIDLDENWEPKARVAIDYDWTEEPGIDLLGTRIKFASKADHALEPHIKALEAKIPALLREQHSRELLEKTWAQAFTVISVNRKNPEVWIRLTPKALHVAPFSVEGRTLTLPVTAQALAETFLGNRPKPTPPTPLPNPSPQLVATGVSLKLPVIASYDVLEPVLAKALGKLSKKGLTIQDYGTIDVRFGDVTLYPTTKGRIAVGLQIDARTTNRLLAAKGTLWLTARPQNEPNSKRVAFTDLQIASQTNSRGFDLLVAIANAPQVRTLIATELTQDFTKDYDKLMAKIAPKIAALKLGKSFIIKAELDEVTTGQIEALGQGLYMPVEARGQAVLMLKK